MKNKLLIITCLLLIISSFTWGQTLPDTDEDNLDEEAVAEAIIADDGPSVSIALSNQNYPVTPGDIYVLSYAFRGQVVAQNLVVTSNYVLDLGIFGKVETEGLTYLEMKEEVETIISSYYPGSHPMVVLQVPGEFEITVSRSGQGNVRIVAWGLVHLGDVIGELMLEDDYSLRNIRIIDNTGQQRYYDYYQYSYENNEESNPLVRPGDRIEFNYNRNQVEITGAVMTPGTREILPRDTMDDIVLYIGDFESTADTSRIQKSETIDGEEINSVHEWGDRALFVGHSELIRIHVPAVSEIRSIMYVDINTSQQPGMGSDARTLRAMETNAVTEELVGPVVRIEIPTFEGMKISDILGRIDSHFTIMSDLERCYLVREELDGPVLVNLEAVMNSSGSAANIELKPGDVMGIPSRTVFVTVSGAVYEPGRYYYTPMRTAGYYITLAGGVDPEQGSHRTITIYDEDGNERHDAELIEPGDNVVAVQDNVAFQFDQKFGTVITALTLITTLITLITVTIAVN